MKIGLQEQRKEDKFAALKIQKVTDIPNCCNTMEALLPYENVHVQPYL